MVGRYAIDALVIALAVFAQLEIFVGEAAGPKLLLVPAALLFTLPLFLRRRFPFGVLVVVMGTVAVESFFAPEAVKHFTEVVPVLAIGSVAAYGDRKQAIAGLAVAFGAVVAIGSNDPNGGVGEVTWHMTIAGAAWVVGLVFNRRARQAAELEERANRLEREREERARAAVAEERAQIARELHDVVAHSVSVMVVQAGAVRRLLEPHQERQRQALLAVEQAGREALAEMRRMLGLIRKEPEALALAPQPSLRHLDRLIEQMREAGLPVEVRVEGERVPLPPGVDLSAYRIVQEGLTNTLKHAGPARAEVVVRYEEDAVELEIVDDGRGTAGGDGQGHGLAGMRERVSLYGGELESGPRPEGGFRVRVHLPVEGSRA